MLLAKFFTVTGGDYSALGLTGGTIASSFGKAMHHGHSKSDGSPGMLAFCIVSKLVLISFNHFIFVILFEDKL